jgi:hypothetical protein
VSLRERRGHRALEQQAPTSLDNKEEIDMARLEALIWRRSVRVRCVVA